MTGRMMPGRMMTGRARTRISKMGHTMIAKTGPAMTRSFRPLLVAAGATLASMALAGCISIGTKPPDQLFHLTANQPAPVGSQVNAPLADAIVVLDPDSDRSLEVERVPVYIDPARVAYLKDALWTERPTNQFRALLAETLRARSGRLVVEGSDYEEGGKTFLGGRLLQMGYDARSHSVIVRFDAIRSPRKGGEIESRRFESRVANVDPKAKAVGPALNQAANDVARQVADWIISTTPAQVPATAATAVSRPMPLTAPAAAPAAATPGG